MAEHDDLWNALEVAGEELGELDEMLNAALDERNHYLNELTEARDTIRRLEGELGKRIAQLSSEARELLRVTESRDAAVTELANFVAHSAILAQEKAALAALVGEMRGALFLAQDFGLCTCVGQVPNNVRAHFDNCLDVVVAHVLALDASAAERVLAERDARVRAEAVEPYVSAIEEILFYGDPESVLVQRLRRALLGGSGAPTAGE